MLDYVVETKAIMQRVKEIRIAQKLSVQEVAYRCNMERSNLSRLETGKINLTIKTLCLICNALNIKLTDVVK
ncbi:MAG: helix-turn-helix transcriptional regulator [Bacteroidaceae bacterium]|nr:helix-turn-helix transcriptional regulator [Bacteroidaceae bacterium]